MKHASNLLLPLACLLLASCSRDKSEWDKVELLPVQLTENGDWSMINAKGEVVYRDEFDDVPTLCYNDVFSVRETEGYTVYTMGKTSPQVLGNCEKLDAAGYMEDGVIPVTFPGRRISLIAANGEKICNLGPFGGKEVAACLPGFSDGLLVVKTEEDKFGYADTKGELAIEALYDGAMPFAEGKAVVMRDNKVLVIDKKGETVFRLRPNFEPESQGFKDGYLLASDDERFALVDATGEMTKLPAEIDNVEDYNGRYVVYTAGDRMGVCTTAGESVLKPRYLSIELVDGDRFLVSSDKDQPMMLLDAKGATVMKFNYTMVMSVGRFGFYGGDGRTMTLLGKDGKPKMKQDFSHFCTERSFDEAIYSDYINPDKREQSAQDLVESSAERYGSQTAMNGTYLPNLPRYAGEAESDLDFSYLVSQPLDAAWVASLDGSTLRILRNTIYAIHGRKFASADLRAFFNGFSWYEPLYEELPADWLTPTEKNNVILIKRYE